MFTLSVSAILCAAGKTSVGEPYIVRQELDIQHMNTEMRMKESIDEEVIDYMNTGVVMKESIDEEVIDYMNTGVVIDNEAEEDEELANVKSIDNEAEEDEELVNVESIDTEGMEDEELANVENKPQFSIAPLAKAAPLAKTSSDMLVESADGTERVEAPGPELEIKDVKQNAAFLRGIGDIIDIVVPDKEKDCDFGPLCYRGVTYDSKCAIDKQYGHHLRGNFTYGPCRGGNNGNNGHNRCNEYRPVCYTPDWITFRNECELRQTFYNVNNRYIRDGPCSSYYY